MLMARAAGTRALGVGWGYHPAEQLRAAGADAVVDDPLAIPDALLALLSGTPTCPA
jgi:phosphoglycolate phosphatase